MEEGQAGDELRHRGRIADHHGVICKVEGGGGGGSGGGGGARGRRKKERAWKRMTPPQLLLPPTSVPQSAEGAASTGHGGVAVSAATA